MVGKACPIAPGEVANIQSPPLFLATALGLHNSQTDIVLLPLLSVMSYVRPGVSSLHCSTGLRQRRTNPFLITMAGEFGRLNILENLFCFEADSHGLYPPPFLVL